MPANPASSLPVIYQTLARQARAYGDVDPATLSILDQATQSWNHPPAGFRDAVKAIQAQHPDFSQSLPMSWWEKVIGYGIPAVMFATPAWSGAGATSGGAGSVTAAAGNAPGGGALPATVPGSYASNLYAAGGFTAPSATGAALPATIPGSVASGLYNDGKFTGPSALGTVATNTGGGAASGLLSRLGGAAGDLLSNPKTYAGLAGLLTTLATRPNGGSGGSGDLMSQNPQLQRLLDMSAQRAERTDPLHQAVTQLAMGRLPVNVQR